MKLTENEINAAMILMNAGCEAMGIRVYQQTGMATSVESLLAKLQAELSAAKRRKNTSA